MPYDPRMAAPSSPLAAALERVGDRWSLLLVEALLPGARRFGELSEAVPGIAPNILSDRLRRLESERVVRSTPYSQRPPRFVYELTPEGSELAGALRLLADWGSRVAQRRRAVAPRGLRHAHGGALVLPDLRPPGRKHRGRPGPLRLLPAVCPGCALPWRTHTWRTSAPEARIGGSGAPPDTDAEWAATCAVTPALLHAPGE